jgi:hypothetical protein
MLGPGNSKPRTDPCDLSHTSPPSPTTVVGNGTDQPGDQLPSIPAQELASAANPIAAAGSQDVELGLSSVGATESTDEGAAARTLEAEAKRHKREP